MTKQTTTVPAKWATYEREDLCTAQQMVDAGFTIEYSQADYINKRFELPHDNIHFKKGNLIVWKVWDWITAELIDGYYRKHTHYERLAEIIAPDITKLEYDFYDNIKLPFFCHDDMSAGSWLSNYNDEVEDRSNQMFIYVNATWNFFEKEEKPDGILITFRDENDDENDSLPKEQFYKFSEPTNLLELANYKQFYLELLETLTKKYLTK